MIDVNKKGKADFWSVPKTRSAIPMCLFSAHQMCVYNLGEPQYFGQYEFWGPACLYSFQARVTLVIWFMLIFYPSCRILKVNIAEH